jgi:hypothetical protein
MPAPATATILPLQNTPHHSINNPMLEEPPPPPSPSLPHPFKESTNSPHHRPTPPVQHL